VHLDGDVAVALVHWTWPPTTGGVETHLFDLARFLASFGARVTVITGEVRPEHVDGVEIVSLPELDLDRVRAESALRSPSAATRYGALFETILRPRGVGTVHGHNLHHFAPGPALALDRMRQESRLGLFHTFHETWPNVLASTPVYAGWDGNFAVSEHVQRECVALLGFEPAIVRLGVDTERFLPVERVGVGPLRILHPARILPWKGVHLSVEMLALLRVRGVDATLSITDTQRIADWNQELDEYRRTVFELAHALRVFGQIEFLSPHLEEMPSVYGLADVVVYPTVGEEPFGLVPLEAMSCGRPIVASRSGGIVETVVDGVTGFLVERDNVVALTDKVEALARDPGLRRRMGNQGRQRVIESFDGRSYAAAMLARYRQRQDQLEPARA
jgi:glycosyltransferase involved in cell wall biosynthesis